MTLEKYKCESCKAEVSVTYTCISCYKEVCFDCLYTDIELCPQCLNNLNKNNDRHCILK